MYRPIEIILINRGGERKSRKSRVIEVKEMDISLRNLSQYRIQEYNTRIQIFFPK